MTSHGVSWPKLKVRGDFHGIEKQYREREMEREKERRGVCGEVKPEEAGFVGSQK